jgi:hypothetical protein
MDANSLFHQLVTLAQCSDDLASRFNFKLSPYPTSLSKDGFGPTDFFYVVDSGYLLFRVRWQKGCAANDIMQLYVKYVMCHFGLLFIVVFNRYEKTDDSRGEKSSDSQVDAELAMSLEEVVGLFSCW